MSIRKVLVALVTTAAIAAPVTAQAGTEEEEVFALGAAAGVAAVVILGGVVASAFNRPAPINTPVTIKAFSANDARLGDSHTSYCANRYRTYDAATNTFQPFEGSRRQCVSPFAR